MAETGLTPGRAGDRRCGEQQPRGRAAAQGQDGGRRHGRDTLGGQRGGARVRPGALRAHGPCAVRARAHAHTAQSSFERRTTRGEPIWQSCSYAMSEGKTNWSPSAAELVTTPKRLSHKSLAVASCRHVRRAKAVAARWGATRLQATAGALHAAERRRGGGSA